MVERSSFKEFREYCGRVEESLNLIQGYQVKYLVSKNCLLKEHDGEYLEIIHDNQERRIKINLCYSIAYQIPIFYFMVYDNNSQPISAENIYENFMHKCEEIHPKNESKGIYLTQNVINKEYFYTLHHCQLTLALNYLIPFYLSLLGLHPPLIINR